MKRVYYDIMSLDHPFELMCDEGTIDVDKIKNIKVKFPDGKEELIEFCVYADSYESKYGKTVFTGFHANFYIHGLKFTIASDKLYKECEIYAELEE